MTYHDICRQNRALYGYLEKLTLCEGHAITNKMFNKAKDYTRAKAGIKKQIDTNLDKLEKIWDVQVGPREKTKFVSIEIRKLRKQNPNTIYNADQLQCQERDI